jgi:hypothetical protein
VFSLLPVRLEHCFPLDFIVIEEAVRRNRLAPAVACLRYAYRRLCRQLLDQCPRSFVHARVAKVEVGKFSLRPAGSFQGHGSHEKNVSKRETANVCKLSALRHEDDTLFPTLRRACGNVYKSMPLAVYRELLINNPQHSTLIH